MKRVYLIVLALMTFSGCMSIYTESESPETEVGFSVAKYSPQTKGSTQMDTSKTFKVFGIYTGSDDFDPDNLSDAIDYIPGVEISNINGKWKNKDNTYYWPKVGKLHFTAYSPVDADLDYDKSEAMFYKADYDVSVQEDLLIADLAVNMEINDGIVPIIFRHALSQVNINTRAYKLKEKRLTFEITVKKIKFSGISKCADFCWTTDNQMHWGQYDSAVDYIMGSTPVSLDTSDVKSFCSNCYMIPQSLKNASVVVDYELVTKLGFIILDKTTFQKSASLYGDIKKWSPGVCYTYNIIISPVSSDNIEFSPVATDWVSDDSKTNI